jgi:hypothetical protein
MNSTGLQRRENNQIQNIEKVQNVRFISPVANKQ